MFSLVKISGKLYKSCLCLILSQSRRCLYIALCLSVSACCCVWTSRVLFVLPMYEELQAHNIVPLHLLSIKFSHNAITRYSIYSLDD